MSAVKVTPASNEEIEDYRRGYESGVMTTASPNVVAALIARVDMMRLALLGVALGERVAPSWCDDGFLCEHPECKVGREALDP